MSSIDAKEFNEMLRNDKLLFPKNEFPNLGLLNQISLLYKGERLKNGIEYALTHFEEIAQLECKNIPNHHKGITIAHLKAAKSFIAVYQEGDKQENAGTKMEAGNDEEQKSQETKIESNEKSQETSSLALKWLDSISEFLINCHLLTHTIPKEFIILTDGTRIETIHAMFGEPDDLLGEYYPEYNFKTINFDQNSYCTQIIFDSADLQSAMDTLLARSPHPYGASWDINIVFIQESLRKEVMRRMNINRMFDDGQLMFEERGTKLGGKVYRNANSEIDMIFDVLPKYLNARFDDIICINFFRTAKEVNALVKELPCKLFSIWTEKIGLFYEMISKLNGSIIWSNCVGLIDENTVRTFYGFNDIRQSGHSMINTDERYAVHRLQNDDGSSKYVVIPFGVTFAN